MHLQKKIRLPGAMKKRPLAFLCLLAALLLFPAGVTGTDRKDAYEEWDGKRVTLTGRVYKKETVSQVEGPVSVVYLKLWEDKREGAGEADMGPPGKRVICYLSFGQREPEIGSTVRLSGKLKAFERASNPGQFDAISYYQIFGISYRLSQAEISAKTAKYNRFMETLYTFRRFLSGALSEALPPKEASVMQTMLLGEKGGMEKELKALYQRNGIAHILAISGLHISLLGMGLYRILRRCGAPMKAAAALSFGVIFLYGAMTGFSVSSVRAVFMFSIRMLGVLLKRSYDMITAAALAAAVILIKQPLYFTHSGFWFSFGCVLGIGLLIPLLTERKCGKHDTGKSDFGKNDSVFWQAAKRVLGGIGMAAVTLPLYLWFYYQFPVYSIFLNFLVIPLMSLLMAAGLALLVCQILFPAFSFPFSLFIKGVLLLYEKACELCENLPGHLFTPGKPEIWQIALCLLLFVLLLMTGKKTKLSVRWGIVLLGVLLLTLRPPKGLSLVFLDVGQGDCIYIENGNKSRYLVDGGSSSVSGVGEYRIIPFLKSRGAFRLDAVFVTHPDEDHVNGIRELLETGKRHGIEICALILPDISESARSESYLELAKAAGKNGVSVAYISRGQMIKRGELTIKCLHPAAGEALNEPNKYSIALGLSYRDFSAMLTGDVENGGERQLVRYLEEGDDFHGITVLKAAHHGSKNSTGEEFLRTVHPQLAVISAGKNNKYGHPHEELLMRLEDEGSLIYETAKKGAVTAEVEGKRVRVRGFLD